MLLSTRRRWRPARCYIAPSLPPAPARGGYLDRILEPARACRFPEWYLRRLEGFRTSR